MDKPVHHTFKFRICASPPWKRVRFNDVQNFELSELQSDLKRICMSSFRLASIKFCYRTDEFWNLQRQVFPTIIATTSVRSEEAPSKPLCKTEEGNWWLTSAELQIWPLSDQRELAEWAQSILGLRSFPNQESLSRIIRSADKLKILEKDKNEYRRLKALRVPELEVTLRDWIFDQNVRWVLVNRSIVKEFSKWLLKKSIETFPPDQLNTLKFSNGLLERFQKKIRMNCRHLHIEGSSADVRRAVKAFPKIVNNTVAKTSGTRMNLVISIAWHHIGHYIKFLKMLWRKKCQWALDLLVPIPMDRRSSF